MNKLLYILLVALATACGPTGGTEITVKADPHTDPNLAREIEDWNPKGMDRPLDEMIKVETPRANALLTSPITVRGQAVGGWYFEGDFPITLLDAQGKVLATAPGRAQGEWMQRGFSPFATELSFDAPAGTIATLRLELDNPAAPDEGFQRAILIPVILN